MKIVYTITPKLAVQFKEPFGLLIEGPDTVTMAKLGNLISFEKPPMVIAVGDVVSKNMHAYGFSPVLSVTDSVSLRGLTTLPPKEHGEKTVFIENPQGTITAGAIEEIKKAIQKKEHTHIVVNGEEDLLVITAVEYAPQDSLIVYGQPHCGIVVVKVTEQKKAQVKGFLKEMKPTKS